MPLKNDTTHTFLTGEEKGIDVRLAIDVIRMAHHGAYDVPPHPNPIYIFS